MKLIVAKSTDEMAEISAKHAARVLNEAIEKNGSARLLLSTGASQLKYFEEFVKQEVKWHRVEMFHLDEYVGISPVHPASFNNYLTKRFVDKVLPGKIHLINGESDPFKTIAELTKEINEKDVDLGLIGIGENAHIAFNDPPADFDDPRAYKIVTLAPRCLQQQVGEGWFKNVDETYKQAISMTCPQIMKCRHIISVVPYKVKAEAIYKTFSGEINENVPATLLKKHADATVYCDADSASLLTAEIINEYTKQV